MDEAYTIGIRLALEDGASAGIAMLRRDLAALDRAMTVSMGGLERLRERGSAVGRALPPPPPLAQPQPRVSAPDATTIPLPPVPALASPPPFPRPSQPVPALPPAFAPLPPPAPVLPHLQTEPAAPSMARVPQAVSPVPGASFPGFIATTPSQPAPMQSAAVASTPRTALARPTAPTAATIVMAPPARPETSVHNDDRPAPARPADRGFVPAPVNQAAMPGPLPARMPAFADLVPTAPQMVSVVMPSVEREPGRSVQPTTIPPAVSFPTSEAASDRLAGPPMASAMAPPAREQEGGASEGDVYLDGMRIGRWMVDTLSRQAARPPAGRAAFDPRLGLAWPGTQQGN